MGNSSSSDMGDAKAFVERKINGKRVVVFSKTHCPYCTKAKDALKKLLGKELPPEEYEVIELDNRNDGDKIQDYLANLTGARSVPRVFIKGKFIGGGNETAGFAAAGQLAAMVSA